MPSQEATILGNFLLAPAALRNFLTFEQFTNIFPSAQRENLAVRELYQELQRLRNEDIKTVRENISREVKASRPLQRAYARTREQDHRKAVAGLDHVALDMEQELSGDRNHSKPHTLQTVHKSIQNACQSIEAEMQDMEGQLESTLSELQDVVGDLSDLRYGSFPNSVTGDDISEEVLATLKRLEAACTDPAG